jgi:hypothetical protein
MSDTEVQDNMEVEEDWQGIADNQTTHYEADELVEWAGMSPELVDDPVGHLNSVPSAPRPAMQEHRDSIALSEVAHARSLLVEHRFHKFAAETYYRDHADAQSAFDNNTEDSDNDSSSFEMPNTESVLDTSIPNFPLTCDQHSTEAVVMPDLRS